MTRLSETKAKGQKLTHTNSGELVTEQVSNDRLTGGEFTDNNKIKEWMNICGCFIQINKHFFKKWTERREKFIQAKESGHCPLAHSELKYELLKKLVHVNTKTAVVH